MECAEEGCLQVLIYFIQTLIQDLLMSHRYFEEDLIWKIAQEILTGIQALHEIGVIHRDIKSANILLKDGTAKICDLNSCSIVTEGDTTT